MTNERTPLLGGRSTNFWDFSDRTDDDLHSQFCKLIGIPPSDVNAGEESPPVPPKSLYGRALDLKKHQGRTYVFTATLSNTLLLSQVVLGAALTALGAAQSSHVLITLFGATNTIIAGIVAYLKSRGQPMRARMFRDDLERVVDEIENSEIMWRGISKGMHGYDDIDINDKVTIRSEVARLTRLYDKAVRTNTMNNPDMYQGDGASSNTAATLRQKNGGAGPVVVPSVPVPTSLPSAPAVVAPADPDISPATAPLLPTTPAPVAAAADDAKPAADASKEDPDNSPASTDPPKDHNHDATPESSDKGKSPAA